MGDWNAILDPKIDKVGRGASRLLEEQYLLTGDTGLPGAARIPNQAGVSGGGYRE